MVKTPRTKLFIRAQRDIRILLSNIWLNLVLFIGLMGIGAIVLRFTNYDTVVSWPQVILDTFNLAMVERLETNGKITPILLSFILPIGSAIILGEGILRVFSIYMQRKANRKEWDLMVAKSFIQHAVICGVGEMGQQIIRGLIEELPTLQMVLIDPQPGILAESGLSNDQAIQLQGSMTDIDTLKQANVQTARIVILSSGEDTLNLEAAYKIHHLNDSVPVWVRLHRSGLAELMDLSRKPNIHFFCPYQQAARSIVDQLVK